MAQKIQSVKGMNDLLPVEQKDFKLTAAFWQAFEDTVGRWTRAYRLSANPYADCRANRFVCPLHRRGNRCGRQGNVHLLRFKRFFEFEPAS